MIHAIGVDALNPAGRPDPGALLAVGATGIRSVFFDRPDWFSYHRACKVAGLASIVTLARESFGDRHRAEVIAALPTNCDYVVIGNEPDSSDVSSWQMSPSTFRSLIQECAPLVHQRCPGAKIVAGGLVSGNAGWLNPIADDIRLFVDFIDIHPYNKTPGEAETLLDEYWERYLIPLVVFEWNRPPTQIRAFVQMLERTVDSDAWFCWSDAMA